MDEQNIRSSMKQVGRLYPVLRDAEGKLIDGFHRIETDPNWESVTLEEVKTKEDRLIVSAHANFSRREIGIREKTKLINELAQIYLDQGLKPDHKRVAPDADGRMKNRTENQIMQKLVNVLAGAVGKATINKYLDLRFKNQAYAQAMSKKHRERQDDTPAYELIVNSFGKHISRSFGKGIFPRMKREMIAEAKEGLRNDPRFIEEIKASVREEIEAQIAEELEILKGEWSLEKQNFFNMANHYGEELKNLTENKKLALGSLTTNERASLRREGIITQGRRGIDQYSRVSLGARLILGLVPGVSE